MGHWTWTPVELILAPWLTLRLATRKRRSRTRVAGAKARTVTGAAVAVARANRGTKARLLVRQAGRDPASREAATRHVATKHVARGAATRHVGIGPGVAIRDAAIRAAVRVVKAKAAAAAMIDRIDATTIATATTNR
jgi:hypothetical protein